VEQKTTKKCRISRRDFLKVVGLNLSGLAIPNLPGMLDWAAGWPSMHSYDLPVAVREILTRVHNTKISAKGDMYLLDRFLKLIGQIPVAKTRWNLERSKLQDNSSKTCAGVLFFIGMVILHVLIGQ
jgi:hypothetical protein